MQEPLVDVAPRFEVHIGRVGRAALDLGRGTEARFGDRLHVPRGRAALALCSQREGTLRLEQGARRVFVSRRRAGAIQGVERAAGVRREQQDWRHEQQQHGGAATKATRLGLEVEVWWPSWCSQIV